MDETTWAALTVVLAVLGAVWTYTAFKRRGSAAGLRALAWTLVPVALGLTGTLRLAGDIVGDVSRWAGDLVLSPVVWAGIAAAGLSAVLFVVSGWMLGRGAGVKAVERKQTSPAAVDPAAAPQVAAGKGGRRADKKIVADGGTESGTDSGVDADVDAILRKHGIQ